MPSSSLPVDFMERVVAWPGPTGPGFVNLHWASDHYNGMPGKPFKDLHEFMNMAQYAALKPGVYRDLYFCTSVQQMTGNKNKRNEPMALRNRDNVLSVKSIWFDIDVKPEKGYPTINDAVAAVRAFIKAAGMPRWSALVSSGGGLHVYWISNTAMPKAEWQAFANGLRHEGVRLGLKFDEGITIDSARVMRVPGTFNRKIKGKDRAVTLLELGQSYDFDTTPGLAYLRTLAPVAVTAPVTKPMAHFDLSAFQGYTVPLVLAPLNAQATVDNLSAGVHMADDRPLDYTEVFKGCGHFMNSFTTHGAGQSQGLWQLTVLATTWFEDGRSLAHTLSKGYPTYDKDETDAMFDRKTRERAERNMGWPSCTAFENDGCKACASCPYKGKLRSPLNLANRVPDPEPPTAVAPPPPEELSLPPGFTVNDEGVVCVAVDKVIKGGPRDGESTTEYLALFQHPMRLPWLEAGVMPGLNFQVHAGKSGWLDVRVTDLDMSSDQSLMKSLGGQLCHTYVPGERHVRNFMTSWVKRIENEQKRLRTAAFGWLFKDELTEAGRHGFAYGGKAFHTDGTVGMSGHVDRATMEAYTPKGSEQYIHDLFGVMTEQHNPGLEVLVAAAFAGPLMYVTGEKNAILWATSNETGIGKSTSIMTGMGVWCAPERAKENATASLLSIQDRLGTLRNLTLFVDEIALQAQVEALAKNVNVFTEGTAGGKLDQNRNQRDKKPWQSILVVGSNQSVRDYFCKVNKTSPSSLARALEMRVRPTSGVRTLPGDDVMRKVENLNRNFGHIGLRYAEFLAKNHERILTDGMALIKDFKESVGFRDGERFWMALCVTILLGAALANELMGKDYFHIAEMREYLTAVYMDNRKFIEENTDEGASFYNTYDVLTAFLKSIPDHQLWTQNMQMGRGRQAVTILHRYNGINPKPVHVHWCTDQRLLRISQTAFLHFLEDRPVPLSPTPIRMGLREQFGAKFDVTRVNLVAGTKIIAQNPETVIEIPIPANSLLEGSLFAYDVDGNAAPYTVAPGDQNVTVTTSADALAIAAATGAVDLAVARGTSAP